MTKELPLTQGKVALVDDEDYERLKHFKWSVLRKPDRYYARRNIKRPQRGGIYLHREIMNAPPGMQVDHINGDGLDCRRANMRLATNAENGQNRIKRVHNTSGFKGVRLDKRRKKWSARIWVNNKEIHLGMFEIIEEAARAYDEAARKYHGEFARTNFGEDG